MSKRPSGLSQSAAKGLRIEPPQQCVLGRNHLEPPAKSPTSFPPNPSPSRWMGLSYPRSEHGVLVPRSPAGRAPRPRGPGPPGVPVLRPGRRRDDGLFPRGCQLFLHAPCPAFIGPTGTSPTRAMSNAIEVSQVENTGAWGIATGRTTPLIP